MINKIGRDYRIVVGTLDVSDYLIGFDYALPLVDPNTVLSWTGSLQLSANLATTPPFSLDDRTNSNWSRGVILRIEVENVAGVLTLARTLRILSAFYEEDARTLDLELTDILGLLDYRTPPENAGSLIPGVPKRRSLVIKDVLLQAGVAEAQIDLSDYVATDNLDFTLTKATGSLVQMAQRLAAAEQYWLWVDPNEIVRAVHFETPESAVVDRTRAQIDDYKRIRVSEQLPSLVRSVGTRIDYGPPVIGTDETTEQSAFGYEQNEVYYTNRTSAGLDPLNREATFVHTRSRTVVSGSLVDGVTSVLTVEYSRVSTGTDESNNNPGNLEGGINRGEGGYLFFAANGFSGDPETENQEQDAALEAALVLARRTTQQTYYNSAGQVTRTLQTVEVARSQLPLHYTPYTAADPPSTGLQEGLLTLQTTEHNYTIDGATNEYTADAVEVCNLQYGTSAGQSPTAGNEYLICTTDPDAVPGTVSYGPAGVESEVAVVGECTIQVTANPYVVREREIRTDYALSEDQHERAACAFGKILKGRSLGYEISLEQIDELLFEFEPFKRIDVLTPVSSTGGSGGLSRAFVIDAPVFAFEARESEFRCQGLFVEDLP